MLHKVVIFYVLAFVFTIILAGIQEGASISPEAVILPQWGSGLAALVMLVIFRGDRHRFSVVDRSIPLSRYVMAALVPLGGAFAAYLINTLILGAIPFGDTAPHQMEDPTASSTRSHSSSSTPSCGLQLQSPLS
jgi:hypothetical protein